MSSARGNVKRTRPQKHQNQTKFKNNLHDTSKKTKEINSIQVAGCCERCTEQIEWKIKYKKYKPLTVPKKCTKCEQKAIKQAYCLVCQPCAQRLEVCVKCGQRKEISREPGLTEAEQQRQEQQLENELQQLPERKRRTFHRLIVQGKLTEGTTAMSDSGDEVSDKVEDTDNQSSVSVTRRTLSLRSVRIHTASVTDPSHRKGPRD